MGKIIINESNPFFDVGGKEGDVMYNFRGNNGIKKGSMLYGKTVNLSEMYDNMLSDVKDFLFNGEYIKTVVNDGMDKIKYRLINMHINKKYGITIENVYNKIKGYGGDVTMTMDIIYNELKNKYGVNGVDWMYLYDNVDTFRVNDYEIRMYIGNRIISNEIYEYFVRTNGLRINNWFKNGDHNYLMLEWDIGNKNTILGSMVRNYNQWWQMMTINKKGRRYRGDIRDYDRVLRGRNVSEVFPVYCPVFKNLVLNYTKIDFSNGKNNIKKCSEIAGYSDKGETWSFASIDRIDSNKGYSYDNIRIISQYANHLKNVGNIDQLRRLVRYMDEQNSYF